jgi:hypothetical protein
MGGVNARLHSRVSFHYGPEAFPWERQDAGDIGRYRMTPSVAAAVLDSLAVASPDAKE